MKMILTSCSRVCLRKARNGDTTASGLHIVPHLQMFLPMISMMRCPFLFKEWDCLPNAIVKWNGEMTNMALLSAATFASQKEGVVKTVNPKKRYGFICYGETMPSKTCSFISVTCQKIALLNKEKNVVCR